MQYVLTAFLNIVLLRTGPDTLPESRLLLSFACIFYLVVNVISILLTEAVDSAFLLLMTDLLLMVAWAFTILIIFEARQRLTQTLTALLGAGAVLQVFILPLSLGPPVDQQTEGLVLLRALGFLLILLWAVAVYGQIIARAINKGMGAGVLLSTLYFLLSFQLAAQLLPAR